MISLPLVRYVLQAAARDRLVLSCVAMTLVGLCLSLFVGSAAVVEKQQFVTVYTAGGLRMLCVLAMVLFVAFFIRRSFDQRDVEFLLSRPLTRVSFILSHAVALVVVAALLAVITGLAVSATSIGLVSSFYIIWTISLFLEIMMIGFVALFFAMVLPSATVSALSTFGFYVLARMTGQVLGIIQDNSAFWGTHVLGAIMKVIAMIVPRFDLMTQTSWLIYGPQGHEGWLFLVAQAGAFSFLVLTASVIDLVRRQF
jgi:ABC-type transport system involved in multi-copper enzyme maturation permease subunit